MNPGRRRWSLAFLPVVLWGLLPGLLAPASDLAAAPPKTAPPVEADPSETATRWYRCAVGESPCGRLRETRVPLDDGGTRTDSDLVMRFVRDGTTTSVRIRTSLVTDAGDRPRSIRHEQRLGEEPTITEWFFEGDEVLERRVRGEAVEESRRPIPVGDWLLPGPAMDRARRIATPASPATLLVLEASLGLEPREIRFRPTGRAVVDLGEGRSVEGTGWELTDPDGTVTVEILDDEGTLLSSRTSMGPGLGDLELVLADREVAESAAGGRLELLESGLISPSFEGRSRSLDRRAREAYRVGLPEDAEPLPSIGGQRVSTGERPSQLLVSFDAARGSPVEAAFDPDPWLEPTATLDHDDLEVARFARRHAGSGGSAEARAESLRRAVHRHISRKGLGTAFAGAGETVRSRRGDCTEHAVLLAASLRAIGIPSRLVSGLVWTPRGGGVDGGFVGHMWTQAVLDGRWHDLDATSPANRPLHAGRLAIAASDGTTRGMERAGRRLLGVFGALDVEVLDRIPEHDTDTDTEPEIETGTETRSGR